jgi:hypothetical protein
MFDSIKINLFSLSGVIVTILHVTFVLGAIRMADEVLTAWHGDLVDSTPPKRK